MPQTRLLCLDVETVPDRGRLPPAWGEKFPKALFHRVVAIGVVEARIEAEAGGQETYRVTACRCGGGSDWEEERLLKAFWRYLATEPSRVVTWNGRGFDLPVLTQRSLLHGVSARAWFTGGTGRDGYRARYADEDHCDLMDALSGRGACTKLGLDEAARAVGCPGKLDGDGSQVETLIDAGEIERVRRYCQTDVLNLFCLYVRYARLTGRISGAGHAASLHSLSAYLAGERGLRPHLGMFLDRWRGPALDRHPDLAREPA